MMKQVILYNYNLTQCMKNYLIDVHIHSQVYLKI